MVASGRAEVSPRNEASSRPETGRLVGVGSRKFLFRRLFAEDRFAVHPDGRLACDHSPFQQERTFPGEGKSREEGRFFSRDSNLFAHATLACIAILPGMATALTIRAMDK